MSNRFDLRVTTPRITMVTTMKDEAPYILDWVAHYRSLGVTDFLIFTNDCTDQTDHILRILNGMGVVQHRFNRVMRRGPHKSALMWALSEPVVTLADWVFVADVDEYLYIPSGNGTLTGMIKDNPDTDAISFVWRLFGNAGVDRLSDRPVPEEFRMAQRLKGGSREKRMFKTMHRLNDKFARLGVHRPFLAEGTEDIRWILPDGTPFPDELIQKGLAAKGHFGYAGAQLNHYALRSMDGFLNKRARGRANHHMDTIEADYWRKFNHNFEEDNRLSERFEAAGAIKSTWLRNDALRHLHEEALVTHQRRARRARRDDDVKTVMNALKGLAEPSVIAAE